MKTRPTIDDHRAFRLANEKKAPPRNTSFQDVASELREVATSIGIYRLLSAVNENEGETLCSLQTEVAEIADKFTQAMKNGSHPPRATEQLGGLAVQLVDSLIESRIQSISPELYGSVRDAGVELLDFISPTRSLT